MELNGNLAQTRAGYNHVRTFATDMVMTVLDVSRVVLWLQEPTTHLHRVDTKYDMAPMVFVTTTRHSITF